MEKDILLKAQNINKEYENISINSKTKIKAVDNINFEIYKGESLGLVGESGCGKSTLAKIILQLQKSDSGSIEFEDRNIFDLSKKEKKRLTKDIQMIFQDPYSSLNPRMKVFDIIAEPLKAHKIYNNKNDLKTEINFLMEKVGISKELKYRYPHQFSGGQRQRIGIARAIALNPKLLILDEAVSALDVSIQAQILNLLKDIKDENNISYLFISHDLSVVKFISDRVMVMYLGEIVEIGHTKNIFSNPKHPYTKLLIDSIPSLNPNIGLKIDDICELKQIKKEYENICKFYYRCPYASDICLYEKVKLNINKDGDGTSCHFPLERN